MHPLLRFTLDLFDALPTRPAVPKPPRSRLRRTPDSKPFRPVVHVDSAQEAPNFIASEPASFIHPRASRQLRLGNAVVAYEFERSRRRTIGLAVGSDGLSVRAPRWSTFAEVDAVLQGKAAWILRKLAEGYTRRRCSDEARIVWRDGVDFPLLGETVQVRLDPGHGFAQVGAELDTGVLRVALAHSATSEQIRDAVQAWLMRQALAHFRQRLAHFAPLLQVQWQRVSLSNAATRWGSARVDGSIRLNWRLIHFRPAVIDYVVVHELSHLREMNHSPRFWSTVGTVVPNYAELRADLKNKPVPRW